MNSRTLLRFALAFALAQLGCHRPVPCSTCNGEEDLVEEGEEEALPDLPCGGADLQTDNQNCGECGLECLIQFEYTPYAAGACQAGECGPHYWTYNSVDMTFPETCADVCASFTNEGVSCTDSGCPLAGFVCGTFFGNGCEFGDSELEITTCDEIIEIPVLDPGAVPVLACCCE